MGLALQVVQPHAGREMLFLMVLALVASAYGHRARALALFGLYVHRSHTGQHLQDAHLLDYVAALHQRVVDVTLHGQLRWGQRARGGPPCSAYRCSLLPTPCSKGHARSGCSPVAGHGDVRSVRSDTGRLLPQVESAQRWHHVRKDRCSGVAGDRPTHGYATARSVTGLDHQSSTAGPGWLLQAEYGEVGSVAASRGVVLDLDVGVARTVASCGRCSC